MIKYNSRSVTYGFLSNFYQEPDGTNVEREYQAQKCADPNDIVLFDRLTGPQAKKLGRRVKLRSDWTVEIRKLTMFSLVWQKFVDHEGLLQKLLATDNEELVESGTGNTFWGEPRNEHGKILMEVREKMRLYS